MMDTPSLETETVQVWKNGVMTTAECDREKAIKMVKEGDAKIISEQAISIITE